MVGDQWYTRNGYKLRHSGTAKQLNVYPVACCDECNGRAFDEDEMVFIVDDGTWSKDTGIYLCERHFKVSGIKEGVS